MAVFEHGKEVVTPGDPVEIKSGSLLLFYRSGADELIYLRNTSTDTTDTVTFETEVVAKDGGVHCDLYQAGVDLYGDDTWYFVTDDDEGYLCYEYQSALVDVGETFSFVENAQALKYDGSAVYFAVPDDNKKYVDRTLRQDRVGTLSDTVDLSGHHPKQGVAGHYENGGDDLVFTYLQ